MEARAGVGKPPGPGGAGGSSCCSRRICSARTWPDGPATAIITVTMPSSPCHCHHHCATVIIVPPSSLCHCHHHSAAVTMTLLSLLLSSLCHHCQTTTLITALLPSSPSHCHCCHHHAALVLGEPPSPSPEWEKLPQHPQCPLSTQTGRAPYGSSFVGRAFLAQVGELGGALL